MRRVGWTMDRALRWAQGRTESWSCCRETGRSWTGARCRGAGGTGLQGRQGLPRRWRVRAETLTSRASPCAGQKRQSVSEGGTPEGPRPLALCPAPLQCASWSWALGLSSDCPVRCGARRCWCPTPQASCPDHWLRSSGLWTGPGTPCVRTGDRRLGLPERQRLLRFSQAAFAELPPYRPRRHVFKFTGWSFSLCCVTPRL